MAAGLIVRAFKFADQPAQVSVSFLATAISAAWTCSPIEDDDASLDVAGATITLAIPSRSLACARVVDSQYMKGDTVSRQAQSRFPIST